MNRLAEFLKPQPRFICRTGCHAVQILPDQRKEAEHRKALQGQENPAAGPLAYSCQGPAVLLDLLPLDQVAGSFQSES